MTDWRLPENRRECFQRFYSFHLKFRTHPGCVYFALPAIAERMELDDDGKAWLVWLNGNCENPAVSLRILQEAPTARSWRTAVEFWEDNYKLLEWDTDRRHQKSKFGEATKRWVKLGGIESAGAWKFHGGDWDDLWAYAVGQPYMGRLSAWSMLEYARILFPGRICDSPTLLLDDVAGSCSHRNGLAIVDGYESAHWDPTDAKMLGLVPELARLGESLLSEARKRNPGSQDVCRLTLESALCTYKSWHKRNRRYPNVYADMMVNRLRRAGKAFGDDRFEILWEARRQALPQYLRCEDMPRDPGLCPAKQNHYLDTGIPVNLHREWPDMDNEFNRKLEER